MTKLESMWKEVVVTQDLILDQVSVVPTELARLAASVPPRPLLRRRASLGLAISLLATGAVAAAGVLVARAQLQPLTVSVGDLHLLPGQAIVASAEGDVAMSFSDGSTIDLGPHGRAHVASLDRHGASVVVEQGRARVAVVHMPRASWAVFVGPFRIAVRGTRFSVNWNPVSEELEFALEKGEVAISAACLPGEKVLTSGQSLRASCKWKPADLPPGAAGVAAPVASSTGPHAQAPALELEPRLEPPAPAHAPSHRTTEAQSWRELAQSGRYDDAMAAARREGFDRMLRKAPAPDLIILGDAARLTGDYRHALAAYTAARSRHAPADRSAFALGLVAFDGRHDYARAAEWFQIYLREQPRGPLSDEAEGRLMEALQRGGQVRDAGEMAARYLAQHPHGTYADLARRLVPHE